MFRMAFAVQSEAQVFYPSEETSKTSPTKICAFIYPSLNTSMRILLIADSITFLQTSKRRFVQRTYHLSTATKHVHNFG